jgi:hypothetical protein
MKDTRARVEELAEIVQRYLGTDEPGPDTDDLVMIANHWVERYFESRGYTYYSPAQSAKPEKTKVAERGWFRKWRVPSMIDPNRRPPRVKVDPLKEDPVARAIRRIIYIDQTRVKTPEELIAEVRKETRPRESGVTNLPTNARELHHHLVKIAPALQIRRMFVDGELELYGMDWRDLLQISRPGYIRTEYWQSAQTSEGLWVFTAFRVRRRESDREILRSVWEKVKVLEKLAEYVGEPLYHASQENEDPEVRQAVRALYDEGEFAHFDE